MADIRLSEEQVIKITTDRRLLSGMAHLDENQSADTTRFLASYIILSQILFLRLFSRNRPGILPAETKQITRNWLRLAFGRILDINYKPIFELDVLNDIPENYLHQTFRLIWILEVERIRHELPGRLFHELIPPKIRKMLAAFYTRPQAAQLLARLTIRQSTDFVFDPACGSGTILVSGYRRKMDLHHQEGLEGNPHKKFCEQEIFGSDIMPFAVHLTTANLAAMDPSTTIDNAQIIQDDSLKLSAEYRYKTGIQLTLFEPARKAFTMRGERHDVRLEKVDVVLMNPPFTKIERGIRNHVNMERFGKICGNEVGLWGHFIVFADSFLKHNGIFGAVIPISILEGRETKKIRDFIFSNWTPMYILKSTINYGFSESSEYRDVLLIARKGKPYDGDRVKFALIKKDLAQLSDDDIAHIANQLESMDSVSSEEFDFESFTMRELYDRLDNLMWFCGASNMKNRGILISFIDQFSGILTRPPDEYFKTGYRPAPGGVSSFMFFTRAFDSSRQEEAFLFFDSNDEGDKSIEVRSRYGVKYEIEKSTLTQSLRTGVGIKAVDITKNLDYIALRPYKQLDRVLNASNFIRPARFNWKEFWSNDSRELSETKTRIATLHRINPYSPNTYLLAFCSTVSFSPSDVLNVIIEEDSETAKALCILINSIIFLSQFFLLKEETTGRYINIRLYDYYQMIIFPNNDKLKILSKIFDDFSSIEFPPLREQLDKDFELRSNKFWLQNRKGQKTLFEMNEIVNPHKKRLELDMAVSRALGFRLTEARLREIYTIIVNEMIITKGLRRDLKAEW